MTVKDFCESFKFFKRQQYSRSRFLRLILFMMFYFYKTVCLKSFLEKGERKVSIAFVLFLCDRKDNVVI
jgi:hypothetical protein